MTQPPIDPVGINASFVERLTQAQFPEQAGLPIIAVEPAGWDNRACHLGDGFPARADRGAVYFRHGVPCSPSR